MSRRDAISRLIETLARERQAAAELLELLRQEQQGLIGGDADCVAAGLHATRIDGSPLVYNQRDAWLPDFLICRPELADPVLDAIWGERRKHFHRIIT